MSFIFITVIRLDNPFFKPKNIRNSWAFICKVLVLILFSVDNLFIRIILIIKLLLITRVLKMLDLRIIISKVSIPWIWKFLSCSSSSSSESPNGGWNAHLNFMHCWILTYWSWGSALSSKRSLVSYSSWLWLYSLWYCWLDWFTQDWSSSNQETWSS